MVGGGAEGADTSTPPPAVAVELSVEPSLEHEDSDVRTTTETADGATSFDLSIVISNIQFPFLLNCNDTKVIVFTL